MRHALRQVVALGSLACLLCVLGKADAQIIRKAESLAPPPIAPAAQPVSQAGAPTEKVLVVPTSKTTPVRRLSQLQNTPIQLQGGATAGRVSDFILNSQGGIDYVVVTNNGQNMLVPYGAATFDWNKGQVGMNMDPARFGQIPTFTQKDWSKVFAPDSKYVGQLYSFFGTGATAQSGVNIQGNQGTTPGTLTPAGTIPLGTSGLPNLPGTQPGAANSAGAPSAAGTSAGPVRPAPGSGLNPPQPLTPTLPGTPTTPGSSPTPGTTPSTGPQTPQSPLGPATSPAGPVVPPAGPATRPLGPGTVNPAQPAPTPTPAPAPRR